MALNPNARTFVPGNRGPTIETPVPTPVATEAPAPTPVASPADPTSATVVEPAPTPVVLAEKKEDTPKIDKLSLESKGKEKDEEDGADAVNQEEVGEEDPRDHLNVVFVGHVDAGKSTISGNILVLTGQVDQRTIEKYEREAKEKNRGTWFLAFIMDTNEEERARGKTVEVGRAHFETKTKRYTILDAPGHKNYVPNMIGGASQADVAILVISAKTGEFESGFEKGGQTCEHARLVKTLGVRHLVVVVNKMDEPQIKWAKERYDEIVGKLTTFLRKEAGWAPKDTFFLPISGYTGLNLMEPISKEDCPWWDGKTTLVSYLDALQLEQRGPNDALRIPVTDKYREAGLLNILGKVESGAVTRGQQIFIMPNKITGKVVSVYIAEQPVKRARAGENVRLSITGIEETDVSCGFIVCDPTNLVPVVSEFTAQIVILELLPTNPLFTAGYEAILHIHTATRECAIGELLTEMDKKTRKPSKRKPMFAKDGAVITAKITVSAPVCLEIFDNQPQLGRFMLRDKGKTIAIGKVLKIDK
jgi:peptide chain release factor subunit 3